MGAMDPQDRYFDLAGLAEYSCISVRRLRGYLRDRYNPLPHFKPGGPEGKILVKKSEFDAWVERSRQTRTKGPDLNALVDEILADVHG